MIAAGPTSTTKMPGKMKITSGKISLTAVLAAFSSASWRRRSAHRVALHAQGLGDAGAELVGLNQDRGQAAEIVDAGAAPQLVQHVGRGRPICNWKLHRSNSSEMSRRVSFISSLTFRIA